METPKMQSVRTNTPRVLTKPRSSTASAASRTCQKPPRVHFTAVTSAPAAPSGHTKVMPRTRAQVVSQTHTTVAATGTPTRRSRSSSCAHVEPASPVLSPPPPLYRPPTTPAEVNHFVERMNYEQQLLEAYQQDELRKRGLDASALPCSRPASRCGSVDSRGRRADRPGARPAMAASASASPAAPAHCRRRLAPTRGARPRLASPAPRPAPAAPPAGRAASPPGARPVAAREPPRARPASSASPPHTTAKAALLRPTSVRLGGPTATQAAAKRCAALRPSPTPAVAPRCRPVLSSGVAGRAQTSPEAARSNSASVADPAGDGRLTSPYAVHLDDTRRSTSGTGLAPMVRRAAAASTATSAAPRKTVKAQPPAAVPALARTSSHTTNSTSTSVSSRALSATVPHTVDSTAVPAHGRGHGHTADASVAQTAAHQGPRAAPSGKNTKALAVRQAKIPPGRRPGQRGAGTDASGSGRPGSLTSGPRVWGTELSLTSLNSIGTSEAEDETPAAIPPCPPDVYVPRLRLPVTTEVS